MTNESYKKKLKKGEFEIEVIGDKRFVIEEFEKLKKEGEKVVVSVPEKRGEEVAKVEPEVSLADFFHEKKPESENDFVLAMAYHFFKHQKMNSFNTKNIKEAYQTVRRPVPTNISAHVYENTKKNFLIDKGKKEGSKTYSISKAGIKYVDNDFKKST